MELAFPVEFLVAGTPASLQTKRAGTRMEWRARVRAAGARVLPEGHWATTARVAATPFYFPDAPMIGDIDNIVKPILDALRRHIYLDDFQVDRLVVQRSEPDDRYEFRSFSRVLRRAPVSPRPVLYVRIADDPLEEIR